MNSQHTFIQWSGHENETKWRRRNNDAKCSCEAGRINKSFSIHYWLCDYCKSWSYSLSLSLPPSLSSFRRLTIHIRVVNVDQKMCQISFWWKFVFMHHSSNVVLRPGRQSTSTSKSAHTKNNWRINLMKLLLSDGEPRARIHTIARLSFEWRSYFVACRSVQTKIIYAQTSNESRNRKRIRKQTNADDSDRLLFVDIHLVYHAGFLLPPAAADKCTSLSTRIVRCDAANVPAKHQAWRNEDVLFVPVQENLCGSKWHVNKLVFEVHAPCW